MPQVKLPDGRVFTLPTVHFGCMGEAGSGKSHLIASMASEGNGLLVLACDPHTKLQPYFDRGIPDDKEYTGQFGQAIYIVRSFKTGKPIIQVECYEDYDPAIPAAMTSLLSRLAQLREEVKAGRWKSIGVDSWTLLEYIARQRRTTGPFASESIYGAAKDDLQQIITSRLCTLRCNIGIAFHVESKDARPGKTGGATLDEGTTTRFFPHAIGTLKRDCPAVLGEMYHSVAIPDASAPGGVRRQLQTQPDGMFHCATRIDAPNPCKNEFTALFSNWITKRAAQQEVPRAAEGAVVAADQPVSAEAPLKE